MKNTQKFFEVAVRTWKMGIALFLLLVVYATAAMGSIISSSWEDDNYASYYTTDQSCTQLKKGLVCETFSWSGWKDSTKTIKTEKGRKGENPGKGYDLWSYKYDQEGYEMFSSFSDGSSLDVYTYDWASRMRSEDVGRYRTDGGGYTDYRYIFIEEREGKFKSVTESAPCKDNAFEMCVSGNFSENSWGTGYFENSWRNFNIFGKLVGWGYSLGSYELPTTSFADTYKYSYDLVPSFESDGLTFRSSMESSASAQTPEPGTIGMMLLGALGIGVSRKKFRRV